MAADRSSPKGKKIAKEHREFVAEAEEILERMFGDLSDLHEQRHGSGEVDPDLVNRVFRSAHSLKGLAGMFGLRSIGELSHHLEDILDGLRLGRIAFDSPAVELLDQGVSLLATLMTGLDQGDASGAEDEEAAQAFIRQIEDAVQTPLARSGDELDTLEIDSFILRALTEYEEHRLRENVRRGRNITLVDSIFEISDFEEGLSELTRAVREVGEVISTLPSPGDSPESQIRFSLLVATELDSDGLEGRLDFPDTKVRGIRSNVGLVASPDSSKSADRGETGNEGPADAGRLPDSPVDAIAEQSVPIVTSEIESLRSISETVRVDIRKLDDLMVIVGELAIQRSAVASIAARLSTDPKTASYGAELTKTNRALERKIKELQSSVLDVRMVPLRQIFEKLARVVRRLRRDVGKDLRLEFGGADIELDKMIVEQLVDPLVHTVRNAFDHAFETSEEREASGKSPIGLLRIRAFQSGNHVVIEVEDDGRGMDVDAIHSKALASGLITEDETLSHGEVLNLVFEPGLSTSDEISSTSGRGVGMDIVRSNLAEMGGTVELASVERRGTTVTITLPVTLAIVQALIVRVGTERFAIPLNSVVETLLLPFEHVGESGGREILNLRGEPLLLRRLSEELEIEGADHDAPRFVVVLGFGEQKLGLVVDRLEGQQDAVIKPIKGPVQNVRGISGATEVGGSNAILVIDVSAIIGDAIRRREAA